MTRPSIGGRVAGRVAGWAVGIVARRGKLAETLPVGATSPVRAQLTQIKAGVPRIC